MLINESEHIFRGIESNFGSVSLDDRELNYISLISMMVVDYQLRIVLYQPPRMFVVPK
jgi:hypothetical protein